MQGINDAGDVLFTRRPATGAPRAMLWHDDNANGIPEPDEMRDLTPPGFSHSVGRFLNSRGEALVSVFRSGEDERWMIWRAGEFIPVRYIIRGEAGAPHVEAFNSRDQIVLTVGGNTLPVTHQPNPEADAYLLDPTGS